MEGKKHGLAQGKVGLYLYLSVYSLTLPSLPSQGGLEYRASLWAKMHSALQYLLSRDILSLSMRSLCF